MRISLATMALCAAATAAGAEPVQSYDEYRSWLTACDNTLSCVVKGFADDANVRAELRIARGAGPDGALSAAIAVDAVATLSDVAVDGSRMKLDPNDWTLAVDGETTTISTDRPDALLAFAAALRSGTTLSLGPGAEIPLDGITAALLRMDDRQGRVGGVTALVRPGKAPASAVPPAPPGPTLAERKIPEALGPAEAARLIETVRTEQNAVIQAECQANAVEVAPSAYALGPARALVFLLCLRGAYQSSSIAFLAAREGGASERLLAPTPFRGASDEEGSVSFFTEGDFDPATGTLWMTARGRGLGDCGTTASWIWNGTAFELSALAMQRACGGASAGDWPTLFRSVQ